MTYATNNYDDKLMARAKGTDLPISTKVSIEICKYLRFKTTKQAKRILEAVIEKKEAIPYTRFNWDVGHRPGGMGPGRYPLKASQEILKIIKSVESNAEEKGLSKDNLRIAHLVANKASSPWHYGRQKRRQMKRSHVEIMVEEAKAPKKEVKAKTESKKETAQKTEVETEAKEKAEVKAEVKAETSGAKKSSDEQKPKASSEKVE